MNIDERNKNQKLIDQSTWYLIIYFTIKHIIHLT